MNYKTLAKPKLLPPWSGIVWLVALALLAFVAGLGEFLDQRVTAKAFSWVHSAWLQGPLTMGLALAVFGDSATRGIGLLGRHEEAKLRREIRNQLGTAIATVCAATDLKPSELGAGLFMFQTSRGRPNRLVRVERVRLIDNVVASEVTFEIGVGTVGKCWKKCNIAHHDWARINRKWALNPPDEQTWLATVERTKHGLDYTSWTSLLGKYSEVLAVPVTLPGDGLVGCIAIDRRWHEGEADSGPLLNSRAVKDAVSAVAQVLSATLADGR